YYHLSSYYLLVFLFFFNSFPTLRSSDLLLLRLTVFSTYYCSSFSNCLICVINQLKMCSYTTNWFVSNNTSCLLFLYNCTVTCLTPFLFYNVASFLITVPILPKSSSLLENSN